MANESRVRNNNVQGVLATTMSVAGTTMKAAGLANLEAISSTEHAALVLDPGRSGGAPEIVYVTSHSGGSTSAVIQRGREGTTARTHASAISWLHAPTRLDFIQVVSSTSRPSTPYRGQAIFEADTDKFYGRSIADDWQQIVDLGAWDTSWTPTWTNLTVGNGTVTARWTRVGRIVYVDVRLVFGTTTSMTGSVQVDLPVNATTNPRHIGVAHYFDNGTRHFIGAALLGRQGADNAEFIHTESGNSGTVNATNPFTWTTSDELSFSAVYEAAA